MNATPEPTTADLLSRLTDDVASLVRQELQQAQAEMTAKARQGARGAALLGAAGVLGAMAAGTSAAFAVRVLQKVLPSGTAALVATGAFGGGAAVLAARGIAEIRAIDPVPHSTLASVRADVAETAPGSAD